MHIQNRSTSFANPGVRDFLEEAIIEDNFVVAAVMSAVEFCEVLHTWTLFVEQKPMSITRVQATDLWAPALQRMLDDESGRPLERGAVRKVVGIGGAISSTLRLSDQAARSIG